MRPSNGPRAGFTLLELLLVVFILAVLATTTSSMVDNAQDQARYDHTKARLAQLRRAVVGDEDLRVAASGYTADVGEPPTSVRDLLRRRPVHPTNPAVVPVPAFRTTCDPDGDGKLLLMSSGWRGPYLRLDSGRNAEFRDGWANLDDPSPHTPDELAGDPNFGWLWPAGTMTISSRGADGFDDAAVSPRNLFSQDIAEPIDVDEQHVDLSHWSVEVNVAIHPTNPTPTADSFDLVLRLWWPDPDGPVASDALTPRGLRFMDSTPQTLNFDPASSLPAETERLRRIKFVFGPASSWVSAASAGSNWVPHGLRCLELRRRTTTSYDALPTRQQTLVDLRARAALPHRVDSPMAVP